MQILAKGLNLPDEYVERIRGRAVTAVKNCKGKICLEDAVKVANGEDNF